MHKCIKCEKILKTEYLLNKHLNSKKSCIKEENDEEMTNLLKQSHNVISKLSKAKKDLDTLVGNICVYCKMTFSTKSNLNVHLKSRCKIYNGLINEKIELEKQIDEIKNKRIINNLKDQLKIKNGENTVNKVQTNNINANTINNITNNNITNNNNVIINVINNYGKENLDHISTKELIIILNKRIDGFSSLIEKIHFDKENPRNHNIYIPDIHRKHAMIYKNDKWMIEDRDKLIDKLKDDKILLLDNKVNELNEFIPENTKRIYNGFYNSFISDELDKVINENIKYILYNNRDIPINTTKNINKVD
jgi:dsDNA-binding SOS-regulon protein